MCQLCLFISIQTLSFLGGFICVSTNLGYNGSYVRVSLKSKIPLGFFKMMGVKHVIGITGISLEVL